MTKDEQKREITFFSEEIQRNSAEINIMLVDQNNQRKQRYRGLMLKTEYEDIKAVVTRSLEYICEELGSRTLDVYDLEISIDESIQMVNKPDVIYGDDILGQLSVEYTQANTVTEDTDLAKIKFMVIQIYASNKSLYLFKKYIQPTTAYKTTEKYIFSGGVLKPFTEKIITISNLVDAYLLDKTYYILNRNAFNAMFLYKDVYAKILEDNTELIRKSGLMADTAQFIADCKADGRYLTRLTKSILAKGFEEVPKRKGEIRKVVEDFGLSLSLSDSGEIVYRGKADIPEVLNLLLRHYVIDALTSNKMIAAAIHEYQAGTQGGGAAS